MKIRIFLMILTAALGVAAGETGKLLVLNQPEDWLRGTELLKSKSPDFLVAERGDALLSKAVIPVDLKKRYRLSGNFQTPPGTKSSKLFFGIVCLDKYRRMILPEYVLARPETKTSLIEPAQAALDEIRVKDASNWQVSPIACVAFDVPSDGSLKDLPNRNISSVGIREIVREENGWLIRLNGQVLCDFPAGTFVRLHNSGPTYHYTGGAGVNVNNMPCILAGEISGSGTLEYDMHKFYPGTVNCRVVILPNYDMPANTVTEFSQVTFNSF